MGAAAASVPPAPSPVSREQEEAAAPIWTVTKAYSDGPVHTRVVNGRIQVFFGDPPPEPAPVVEPVPTPATDPTGNALKKRGRPKGSKNKRGR